MGDKIRITVPIAANHGLQCTITPPWFVQKSEYNTLNGTFEFLINGERAFGEVHRAIAAAKKSVCIICWGFQPSMHFVRDGKSLPIGKLLEQKAAQGVRVRVLCYTVGTWYDVSATGLSMDEPNMPNRSGPFKRGLGDKPATSSAEQNDYDRRWFSRYDRDRGSAQTVTKGVQTLLGDEQVRNLVFHTRGFSAGDRAYLASQPYEDKGVSAEMRTILSAFPSHHQKMVLVDHDSPSDHIGFVMGHNMLDAYWDKSDHSFHRSKTSNTGRNGMLPRQDLSSRITGPICGDLFLNFAHAWEKETGEKLPRPAFKDYPLREPLGQKIHGQILRTQPQYKVEDIKRAYLQAVNNATQCIYIENQYFRWPPLADKIKQAAQKQCQWGRDPAEHRSLYLFVVTNSSDDGMGAGTVKTHEMLASLGRADAMPGVELQNRIDNQALAIEQAERQVRQVESTLPNPAVFRNGKYPPAYQPLLDKQQVLQDKLATLKRRREQLQQQADQVTQGKRQDIAAPEPRPGLKVHVCTLAPPDSPVGQPWPEVYVHSKLMTVNDTFMTLGSANVNTRSMEVDSELNIAHCNPHITKQARLDLWSIHTKGMGAQEDVAEAFKKWAKLISDNNKAEASKQSPIVSLRGFLRTDPTRKDRD